MAGEYPDPGRWARAVPYGRWYRNLVKDGKVSPEKEGRDGHE